MQNLTEVKNLLKSFGVIIYTGDGTGDCELMLEDLKELRQLGLIDAETFTKASKILLIEKNGS
ncbi:YqgQ family protein [Staphylospora marina]|uniref:YqgQ family protein n=1 Tax=Staphylospora marina TaxID=2490858 RepID=UPI000F5BB463|nr:YqgQ family protein [Staphylospora marina]